MHLVCVTGPPAVGKMTVGRAVCDLTGFRLFHNHMSIEPLLGVYDFGTPSFERINAMIRREVIAESVVAELPGLVFTFAIDLDDPGDLAQLQELIEPVERAGAPIDVVELMRPARAPRPRGRCGPDGPQAQQARRRVGPRPRRRPRVARPVQHRPRPGRRATAAGAPPPAPRQRPRRTPARPPSGSSPSSVCRGSEGRSRGRDLVDELSTGCGQTCGCSYTHVIHPQLGTTLWITRATCALEVVHGRHPQVWTDMHDAGRPQVWTAGVGGCVTSGGCFGVQRHRIVMMNPPMSRTNPTPRFQTPMDPMGYLYSVT